MQTNKIQHLIEQQKIYFAKGETLSIASRSMALSNLKESLKKHEQDAVFALKEDLGKSNTESFMCEIGMVYTEITYLQKHLKKFTREQVVHTPLAQFPSKSYKKPTPKGTVLIMSPWNYPLMLTLEPLADALAAGNTVVLKPSAYAPKTAKLLEQIVKEAFKPEHVCLITGGRAENQQLLEQNFDHIFFTGSQAVGKEVLRKAAENLTPVSLELGGKSPCIVDKTADLPLAARRIIFGKFLNCGQTCVAPDYILCEADIRNRLEQELIKELHRQFGENPLENPNYGKIINQKHFCRLTELLKDTQPLCGGEYNAATLQISPVILSPVKWEQPVMQEEIFGPILPIITFSTLDEAIHEINTRPHPLALYIFSKDKKAIRLVTKCCQYGGGCINDTIIHLATSEMGFGGIGASGMGAYHGKTGFDTFTHYKSIVNKRCWLDLPMRYQPYKPFYEKIIRLFMR